jgi:hypothetical protein
MKTCSKCRIEKPDTEFYKNTKQKDGLQNWCKTCCAENDKKRGSRRQYKRRQNLRLYGIDEVEYERKLTEQNWGCAICGSASPHQENQYGPCKNFCVDHNHETDEVRGLLCGHCNRGIGDFMENIELLEKAIEYLNKYKK